MNYEHVKNGDFRELGQKVVLFLILYSMYIYVQKQNIGFLLRKTFQFYSLDQYCVYILCGTI